jgi:hypothetical protein
LNIFKKKTVFSYLHDRMKAPHSSGTHFGEESREIQVTFGRNEAPKVLDISGAETSGKC